MTMILAAGITLETIAQTTAQQPANQTKKSDSDDKSVPVKTYRKDHPSPAYSSGSSQEGKGSGKMKSGHSRAGNSNLQTGTTKTGQTGSGQDTKGSTSSRAPQPKKTGN